jgi:hypothetical protein
MYSAIPICICRASNCEEDALFGPFSTFVCMTVEAEDKTIQSSSDSRTNSD